MKTKLTLEESARLIELGVDPKLASECVSAMKVYASGRGIIRLPESNPIFTLTDLLSILPKEIKGYHLEMGTNDDEWYAEYDSVRLKDSYTFAPELIDSIYQLLIWAIGNGYVKPNKDN